MPAATVTELSAETDVLAPVRSELLARPLEFIVAEHHRLRDLCRLLDGIAEAPGSAGHPRRRDPALHRA